MRTKQSAFHIDVQKNDISVENKGLAGFGKPFVGLIYQREHYFEVLITPGSSDHGFKQGGSLVGTLGSGIGDGEYIHIFNREFN